MPSEDARFSSEPVAGVRDPLENTYYATVYNGTEPLTPQELEGIRRLRYVRIGSRSSEKFRSKGRSSR